MRLAAPSDALLSRVVAEAAVAATAADLVLCFSNLCGETELTCAVQLSTKADNGASWGASSLDLDSRPAGQQVKQYAVMKTALQASRGTACVRHKETALPSEGLLAVGQ